MNEKFSNWLDELADESEPEMWCFSKGRFGQREPSISEWVDFVKQAFTVRAASLPTDELWTSYLWYDQQASQLRFASLPCDPENLPFGAAVRLVDGPEMIVAEWLKGDDHILWSDLEEVEIEPPESAESFTVHVWTLPHGQQNGTL